MSDEQELRLQLLEQRAALAELRASLAELRLDVVTRLDKLIGAVADMSAAHRKHAAGE